MITGNEPAMPIIEENTIEGHLGTVMQMHFSGLTIRQHFAAMAMQGLLCNASIITGNKNTVSITALAESATDYADALITELNKTNI